MLEDDDRQDSRIAALERILAVPAVKAARPLSIVLALMGAFAIVPHVQLPPELYAISVNVGVEMLGSLIDRIAHRDLTDEEILDRIQELIDELDLLPTSDYFDPRFELLRSGQRRLSKQNQALEKVIRVEAKETRRQVYEVFEALFPNYVSTDEMPTAEKMVERVEEDFLDEIETHQLFDRELQTKLSTGLH